MRRKEKDILEIKLLLKYKKIVMVDLDDALCTLINRKAISRKHKKYWENKKENVDLLKCFFTKNKKGA